MVYIFNNTDQPQWLLSLRTFIAMDSCLPTSVQSIVTDSWAA